MFFADERKLLEPSNKDAVVNYNLPLLVDLDTGLRDIAHGIVRAVKLLYEKLYVAIHILICRNGVQVHLKDALIHVYQIVVFALLLLAQPGAKLADKIQLQDRIPEYLADDPVVEVFYKHIHIVDHVIRHQ